jgi:5'-deoxynucleotidase YfbR-like HD superfamily hydrolase
MRRSNSQQSQNVQSILAFLSQAEKLKTELRHSWTNDKERQESVAEHSWMALLTALLLFPHIKDDFNQLKTLKMLIVHDIAEVIIGDIPAYEQSDRQQSKPDQERHAINQLTASLPKKSRHEIISLWEEFEANHTFEAKLAKAIDKCEALIQHNISKIATWSQGDYDICFGKSDTIFSFDEFVSQFKQHIDQQTINKMTHAQTIHRVDADYLTKHSRG